MALKCVYRGNDTAKTTIFFLHGWPDGDHLFSRQYPTFEADFRIVTVVLPGFGGDAVPPWGLDFMDVVARIIDTVESVMANRSDDKRVLIAHDWGVSLANEAIALKPTLFDKCVYLDIGGHVGNLSALGALLMLIYQGILLFAFILPVWAGTPLTKLTAWAMGAPPISLQRATNRMNYLDFQLWRRIVKDRLPSTMKTFSALPVPVLFLFGAKKPMHFHSAEWIAYLNTSNDGSGWKSYPSAHWFFTKEELAGTVNHDIRRFLA